MIADKITNLKLYTDFDSRFEAIADFLSRNDAESLPEGRYEICDGVYANVSEYEPQKNGCYEAHRKYSDLQYIVLGSETIGWAEISKCREYEIDGYHADGDYEAFSDGDDSLSLDMAAGFFAYFAPGDAHRPGIFNGSARVKKVVFKISVEK